MFAEKSWKYLTEQIIYTWRLFIAMLFRYVVRQKLDLIGNILNAYFDQIKAGKMTVRSIET